MLQFFTFSHCKDPQEAYSICMYNIINRSQHMEYIHVYTQCEYARVVCAYDCDKL